MTFDDRRHSLRIIAVHCVRSGRAGVLNGAAPALTRRRSAFLRICRPEAARHFASAYPNVVDWDNFEHAFPGALVVAALIHKVYSVTGCDLALDLLRNVSILLFSTYAFTCRLPFTMASASGIRYTQDLSESDPRFEVDVPRPADLN
jgi:hypothetical protein